MIVRIKINALESTAASTDVKSLRQKVREATARLALATELGRLKRELNRTNISETQKARYVAKIKSVMAKAGVTRAPNHAAATNELAKAKARLEKALNSRK